MNDRQLEEIVGDVQTFEGEYILKARVSHFNVYKDEKKSRNAEAIILVTNLYCTLTFYSEREKVEMNDFQDKLKVVRKRSWTIGDLQHPDYEESKRMDSSVVIMSDVSEDNNGTSMIFDFFKYLTSKKEDILFLKEKYKANMYFDIVINLASCDAPILSLNPDQLLLLAEIEAELNYSVYDYK